MKYNILEQEKQDILDDSNITQAINIIKQLIENDFDIEIETESELIDLINSPELFLEDKKIIEEIKDLKDIIIKTGDFYYA